MKNIKTALALTATVLGLASTAQAGFVNGGFDDGTFNGWDVSWKKTYSATWTTVSDAAVNGHQVVQSSFSDPYNPLFNTPFNGSHMARLNLPNEVNADMSRITQTAIMLAGETDLYINWGAVMQDPGHLDADQPFFTVEVNVNGGAAEYFFSHTAGAGGNAGWTNEGSGVWSKSGQAHLAGLLANDSVTVTLTVADCDLGGHFGYAYLDGIGNVQTAPPGVPDGGVTALLFAPAILGLAAFRRRK